MNLVERLRACNCGVHCKSGCIQEKAADEIERLRRLCQKLTDVQRQKEETYEIATIATLMEIERLRAALKPDRRHGARRAERHG